MYEIKKNIFLVPGKKKSQFPYCCCLLVKGRDLSVLIDAGMGKPQMDACLEKGFDILILSHCHVDHRLTIRHIPEKPVWSHEKEVTYIQNEKNFIEGIGYARGGIDYYELFGHLILPESKVQRTLADGDRVDIGGLTLEILHTPGHTPGHLSFYIPEEKFLFAADVDLTPFGPMYGHYFSDIDEFIDTIRKIKATEASIVATGHTEPYYDQIPQRFDDFEKVIYKRDQLIFEKLDQPRTVSDLLNQNLIYSKYPESQVVTRFFEMVHIEKQLDRLVKLGKAKKEGDLYLRA